MKLNLSRGKMNLYFFIVSHLTWITNRLLVINSTYKYVFNLQVYRKYFIPGEQSTEDASALVRISKNGFNSVLRTELFLRRL